MAVALGRVQTRVLEIRTRSGHIVPVTEGMEVLSLDGVCVGRLKGVYMTSILVDRALHRDIYVAFDFIETVSARGIVLTITADRVDTMHWPHPHFL